MTRHEPYLTVRAVQPLVSGLRALGHDPDPLLATADLHPSALGDPDGRVATGRVQAFIERAVEATGDQSLGLHIAEQADTGSFDVHLYAMLLSPTLGGAYERLCRYQRLIHETNRVELTVDGDRATLRHVMSGGVAAPRQSAEFLLAVWVRGGRLATGQSWAPTEVRFAHPAPADPGPLAHFFQAPLRFGGGENALVLASGLLDLPCVRADPALLAVLDRYAADRLDRAPRTVTAVDRARDALAEELSGGTPSADRLAARLKMSVRTLGRTLAAEGTSYRRLLDGLRQELAVGYLQDDRLAIAEVAFLLGFSELAAFHRAFKRWTGQTPVGFRRSHRAQAVSS